MFLYEIKTAKKWNRLLIYVYKYWISFLSLFSFIFHAAMLMTMIFCQLDITKMMPIYMQIHASYTMQWLLVLMESVLNFL